MRSASCSPGLRESLVKWRSLSGPRYYAPRRGGRCPLTTNTHDMRVSDDGTLRLSPSDLANHLACAHLTQLELRVQRGELARPHVDDPYGQIIMRKGNEHEAAYLARLDAEGLRVAAHPDLRRRGLRRGRGSPRDRGGDPERARRTSSTRPTSRTAPGAGSPTSSSGSRTARTSPSTRSSRARRSRSTCSSSASTPSSSSGSRGSCPSTSTSSSAPASARRSGRPTSSRSSGARASGSSRRSRARRQPET